MIVFKNLDYTLLPQKPRDTFLFFRVGTVLSHELISIFDWNVFTKNAVYEKKLVYKCFSWLYDS